MPDADKDNSIIDKILNIAGVDVCAISSLDGEVLSFKAKDDSIFKETIDKASKEISRLFASYSISSIDISSMYLNFEDRNIIINGFGSGFIFIISQKNSNINLLKLETSYLESEFVKIVNQSVKEFSYSFSKPGQNGVRNGSQNIDVGQTGFQDGVFGEDRQNSSVQNPQNNILRKDKLDGIKDLFSSYMGPICEIIFNDKVKELNEDIDNFSILNAEPFVNLLADEIETAKDRSEFIKAAKKII